MATHRHYRQMLPLMIYGDLSEQDRRDLDRHLQECPSCRKDLDETRRLHALLARVPAPEPSADVLRDARLRFSATLATDRLRAGWPLRVSGLFRPATVPWPALVLGSLLFAAFGYFGGTIGEHRRTTDRVRAEEKLRITNIRALQDGDGADMVEFAVEATRVEHVRGRTDDPSIQKVLAKALVDGENAGVRIRAASSVASAAFTPGEGEIRAALILAVRADSNDGVRKVALDALRRFPPDREIRDLLLDVLLHDPNPGLRIAAINTLDSLQIRGYLPDAHMREALRDQLQTDDNPYIRVKAKSILQETYQ
jgi:hypothetical protein